MGSGEPATAVGNFAEAADLELFWASVAHPEQFRDRVVDRRLLRGFEILRTMSIGYEAGPARPHTIAVLRPRRGRVIGGMVVRGGSGREVAVLSQRAVGNVVRAALDRKLNELESQVDTRQLPSAAALLQLSADSPKRPQTREAVDRLQQNVCRSADELLTRAGASGHLSASIARFVGVVGARDLVVCHVPAEEAGLVTLEMREVVGSVLCDDPSVLDRVAVALDALPSRCVVPLYKGAKSQDYQLDLDVGPGNYVKSIDVGREVGISSSGVGTQVASVRTRELTTDDHDLVVVVSENPNNTLLFSVGLAMITAITIGSLLAVPRATTSGSPVALVDLAGLFGPVALVLGAVWAAVGRSIRGRAVPSGALVSVAGSVGLLLLAAGCSTFLDGDRRTTGLWILLVLAVAFAAVAVFAFTRAIASMSRLRDETASAHPVTPLSS